jgi:hypothetical protein
MMHSNVLPISGHCERFDGLFYINGLDESRMALFPKIPPFEASNVGLTAGRNMVLKQSLCEQRVSFL